MYSSSQRPGGDHRQQEYASPNGNPSPVVAQTSSYPRSPPERAPRPRVPSFSGNPHSPQYSRSHPVSPNAARVPLSSPSAQAQDRPTTGYYDPITESRGRVADYPPAQYQPRSPVQPRPQPLHNVNQGDRARESNGYHTDYPPPQARRPSRSPPREPFPHQPATNARDNVSAYAHETRPARTSTTVPQRKSNPMNIMSMLSDTAPSYPDPNPGPPIISRSMRKVSSASNDSRIKPETVVATPLRELTAANGLSDLDNAKVERNSDYGNYAPPAATPPSFPLPLPTGPPGLNVKATEDAYIALEAHELSDVEGPGFEGARDQWRQRSHKRTLDVDAKEAGKRKRRRTAQTTKYLDMFTLSAESARDHFVVGHEKEAEDEVRSKDVEDEKERKKDMQRKRRRERTLQNETAKRDEAMERLQWLEDEEEISRVMKDVQKAGKKIRNTEDLLQGRAPAKEVRAESPRDSNMDGGIMTSFAANEDNADTPKAKKGSKGYRPRKSKEQKLAEKENAAAGQAYIDRGDELPAIAPKEEMRLQSLRRESSELKETTTTPSDVVPYISKGYNQIYEQIWKDLAKNHVSKVWRIKNNSIDTKASNLRKTAQLASKEARRWQLRTNKSMKDVQARAKRSMREMLSFWKRNERDERDQRKMAERQELENAKKAEADREANRQKRKLNFLISQTELYSHFIGKKVKTDDIERSTDDVAASGQTTRPAPPDAHAVTLPDSVAKLGTKVTNFEDLDFDAEDESVLREAAMANAQNAVQEAQDRARAFNTDGQLQSDFDDGEMNFQNPTSLGDTDVTQPKMLNCQLKEYQLKGLNWLVNLYEQGINGILADEMGLGKTVQSISVMAYLAEVHNIWGPFLVIAPASTLHNWQQEIARFVPNIKVLPYWGNAKDRKVLRKFWDRKHITYNRDSPFHVLVTSYQLVVQDTAYFQKIRWQYMILDEAQAIKSSQSSRWKALLGFHCRNRLLLTGTPIQNNMQELWALLHFIMPSLFDSHDEFSDWFSKDIESHAQSNTKLNEDQLKRLHMILKPFMLRRVKKHVQKELGDKIEEDVYCDLTYRQRAYYTNLRNKISIMDLIEKAAIGDDQDTATLMNLVMQFRKVCNHPDLFERAETTSPMAMSTWAETASFMREGYNINVSYSVRNVIEYWLPKRLGSGDGRLNLPGPDNSSAGWREKYLRHELSIWDPAHIHNSSTENGAFAWLRFVDSSAGAVSQTARKSFMERAIDLRAEGPRSAMPSFGDDKENTRFIPGHSMLNIVSPDGQYPQADVAEDSHLHALLNISRTSSQEIGYNVLEPCATPHVHAPPIELVCPSQHILQEKETTFFNVPIRRALYPMSTATEAALLSAKISPAKFPVTGMLPAPASEKQRYTKIQVPSMRRFVTDSGKLAALDRLLKMLKEGSHRVLLYFQMTRMIDLMEEYLTYRNYKYCRLDGSTKLEDRRDTVAAFQSSPEIFVFLLSTRAGGLGINLTAADTVIFYDSDWNPTIDSQAMDRAHRLGQTRQVTVYRLITRGTIEERIRKRALQKEEVQRVVISGGAPAGAGGAAGVVDFNARSRDNRTKDIAMWLADDDQAAAIERKEAELAEMEAKDPNAGKGKKRKAPVKKKEVSMDDMYHEGEGRFDDDNSNKPSGAATPVPGGADAGLATKKKKGISKKAKTIQQRLAVADGE